MRRISGLLGLVGAIALLGIAAPAAHAALNAQVTRGSGTNALQLSFNTGGPTINSITIDPEGPGPNANVVSFTNPPNATCTLPGGGILTCTFTSQVSSGTIQFVTDVCVAQSPPGSATTVHSGGPPENATGPTVPCPAPAASGQLSRRPGTNALRLDFSANHFFGTVSFAPAGVQVVEVTGSTENACALAMLGGIVCNFEMVTPRDSAFVEFVTDSCLPQGAGGTLTAPPSPETSVTGPATGCEGASPTPPPSSGLPPALEALLAKVCPGCPPEFIAYLASLHGALSGDFDGPGKLGAGGGGAVTAAINPPPGLQSTQKLNCPPGHTCGIDSTLTRLGKKRFRKGRRLIGRSHQDVPGGGSSTIDIPFTNRGRKIVFTHRKLVLKMVAHATLDGRRTAAPLVRVIVLRTPPGQL